MKYLITLMVILGSGASQAEEISGKDIYNLWCGACHDSGVNHPGTHHLAATRGAEYSILKERTDLSPDYIRFIIKNGLNGMPPFRPTELSEMEIDALLKYLIK